MSPPALPARGRNPTVRIGQVQPYKENAMRKLALVLSQSHLDLVHPRQPTSIRFQTLGSRSSPDLASIV
jgi:hypothetical protein